MKIICGIYKITSPSNKIYIGRSINIRERFYSYKALNCKSQIRLYNSIKKYGWKNHKFEIIHECSKVKLNELEKYYVDLFQTFNTENGLNLRDGGGSAVSIPKETRLKMSLAHKGKNTWTKGVKRSAEFRKQCSVIRSLRNMKKIVDINNNVIYNSISEAAKENGIKRSTLSMKLLNINTNNTSLRYL